MNSCYNTVVVKPYCLYCLQMKCFNKWNQIYVNEELLGVRTESVRENEKIHLLCLILHGDHADEYLIALRYEAILNELQFRITGRYVSTTRYSRVNVKRIGAAMVTNILTVNLKPLQVMVAFP
jgi:hypothetical protein